MDTIFIDRLEIETIIGIYDHERENKQIVLIDLEMQYETKQACASDNIKYALDYHKITTDIAEFASETQYQLIESLAHAIADMIMKNNRIEHLKLTLSKPQALENTNTVGIIIYRNR